MGSSAARRGASLHAWREVYGVGVEVAADRPALLRVALDEFPAPNGEPPVCDRSLRIRLELGNGIAQPSPPAELARGSHGLAYLLQGTQVWLAAAGGVLFHADLEALAGTVHAPERRTGRRGLTTGLSVLLPYLLRAAGLYPVHTAAVKVAGRQVLLAGVSGSGKSTTAALLMRAGAEFLADDLLFLREECGALGLLPLARPLRLDGRTRAWVDDLPVPRPVPAANRADSDGLPPLLLFPRLRASRPAEAEPLSAVQALEALIGCSLLLGPRKQLGQQLELLGRLAWAATARRLWLGDEPDRVPEVVFNLV